MVGFLLEGICDKELVMFCEPGAGPEAGHGSTGHHHPKARGGATGGVRRPGGRGETYREKFPLRLSNSAACKVPVQKYRHVPQAGK